MPTSPTNVVVFRCDRRDLTRRELLEIISVMLTNWQAGEHLQDSLEAIAPEVNDTNYHKLQNFILLFESLIELL